MFKQVNNGRSAHLTKEQRRERRAAGRARREEREEALARRRERTIEYMMNLPYKVVPKPGFIASIMRQRRKPGAPWVFCVVPEKKA